MLLITINTTINKIKLMNKLYEITTIDKLNDAYYEVAKASKWKKATQLYEKNLLQNNLILQKDLRSNSYVQLNTINFTIHERGKVRNIKSPQIRDRIVQKVLNKYILVPELNKYLIYDNYASIKNRGTSFARKRHLFYLHKVIKQYGRDAYILQIDIRKYFDNIDHNILINMIKDKIKHVELYPLIEYIINNSSETDKGLNLGSETPQICAILYLGYIDNYCKNVEGIKYYGRYMDDIYIFHNDKEYLHSLLERINNKLDDIGLEINYKKTHITKLTHQYTFLQTIYYINDNYKIIRKMTRQKIVRERRKIKRYKRLLDNNKMTKNEIYNSYMSWRYSAIKEYDCYNTIKSMDYIFHKYIGGDKNDN